MVGKDRITPYDTIIPQRHPFHIIFSSSKRSLSASLHIIFFSSNPVHLNQD